MKDSRSCDKKKWFIADKERFAFCFHQNETSPSSVSRLSLLIKLFVVMGVSWLGEALTSMIRFDTHPVLAQIETAWDVFNCLQGEFCVFCVFGRLKCVFRCFDFYYFRLQEGSFC